MTSYLLTGASGMLGRDVQNALKDRDLTALARADLDVADAKAVSAAVAGHDVVINAAAYTRVDEAETHEDDAYTVNAIGPKNLAVAARRHGAKLVTISTDYVFDGLGNSPYPEYANRAPLNAYGRTKAAGEEFALGSHPDGTYVVRTAWLYGAHGPNFAKTMVRLASRNETVSVVADQLGQPTWTADLADQIVRLLDVDAPAGIYHGTNSGETSWFEFAKAIFAAAGLDPARVTATTSDHFVRPALRPAYSVLSHENWRGARLEPMRPWQEALAHAAGAGLWETDANSESHS